MSTRYVYSFGNGSADGKASMKALLGGKGANLADMSQMGLPVPPGFTITTEACAAYDAGGKVFPAGLDAQIDEGLARLEQVSGKTFGHGSNPLLVSVRSGAAQSMPGMMDTVLNLGLNDQTLAALISLTGNERFAWDAYRRFIQMFGDVVLDLDHDAFEHALQTVKNTRGVTLDTELDVDGLKEVVEAYRQVYARGKQVFPQDARQQLALSIEAVFRSWNNPRAEKYRQLNDIRGLLGTAVNVQMMVFGNMGEDSGTGVAFTRNPSTGENRFYGEYLMNAQGEDVVAGIRTPEPIDTLERVDPAAYTQLVQIRDTLERHYNDMQDIEFTIERGRLYMLQTRNGKRTAPAALRIATEMVTEGCIDRDTAIMRIDAKTLDQLLHPTFDPIGEERATVFARGLPASPGAASGMVVFSAAEAEAWSIAGKSVILCRTETSPEDIGGMDAAKGIVTSRGGMTSHAAVVARGMGRCCVAGAGDIVMDYKTKTMTAAGVTIREGDWISLNGSTGTIYLDQVPTVAPEMSGPFAELMAWADERRRLRVRTNADTPQDAAVAVGFGAEGIGLCRTEHMFFQDQRITLFRKLILVAEAVMKLKERHGEQDLDRLVKLVRGDKPAARAVRQYREALDGLLPLQRDDFIGIFRALEGRPCTIRLLDPPLHEFLPHDNLGQREMARQMGVKAQAIKALVDELHEFNPMLGHRGCRLGIAYPEVTAMQTRAICEAVLTVEGAAAEIMIPLIGDVRELQDQRAVIERTIAAVASERGVPAPMISIGTMIEVPRAALTADRIAAHADFFSFGTNDLTQMCCGFSRDDAASFLGEYVRKGIYDYDPFQVLDQEGVGRLVEMAVGLGRQTKPDIKMGICGEHGGDPKSVAFCHDSGLDYVSCSPFRVPIARLAAAQAVIVASRR